MDCGFEFDLLLLNIRLYSCILEKIYESIMAEERVSGIDSVLNKTPHLTSLLPFRLIDGYAKTEQYCLDILVLFY